MVPGENIIVKTTNMLHFGNKAIIGSVTQWSVSTFYGQASQQVLPSRVQSFTDVQLLLKTSWQPSNSQISLKEECIKCSCRTFISILKPKYNFGKEQLKAFISGLLLPKRTAMKQVAAACKHMLSSQVTFKGSFLKVEINLSF